VTNTYRIITGLNKILICFVACLALALSSSCAQKKSAIEKLIVQKPSDETKRKVEEEKIRQSEAKRTLEVTEKTEKDASQAEEIKEQKEQKIGETLDSISEAISNIAEKSKEVKKDRQIKKHVKKETITSDFEHVTMESKVLSLARKKPRKIPHPRVPKNIQIEKDVTLNFESTDVKDIIITFCDLLKIDYIIDPGISGKITLQTFKKAKVKDLFKILEKILILNNLTVIKTGKFYRFMPVESAKKESLNIFFGKDSALVPSRDRLIIQIIPIKNISTSSVKSILAPLLSKNASFLDIPETNNLVIIDTASNIKQLLGIIEIIDIEAAESLQVKLFPIKHSDVNEFAADIKEIFNAMGYASAGPSGDKPKVVPGTKPAPKAKRKVAPRAKPGASTKSKPIDSFSVINFLPIKKINSLLVINPFPDILPDIKFWISKLDRPFKLFIGKDSTLVPDTNEQILQIIPLSFVTPGSLKDIITPMMTKEGSLLSTPDQNGLIIIDFVNNIKWILEIINVLDINTLDKIQVRLILVEHTDVFEIANILTEVFDSLGYKAQDSGSSLKFVPVERLNALIIINPFLELLPNIESWVSRLDAPSMEGLEEKTFIYYVQNTKASDLASLLSTLYQPDPLTSSKEEMDKRFRVSKKEPRKEKKVKSKTKPKPKKPSIRVKTVQSEEVTGNILFVADSFTNAVIIKTLPRNYPAILKTIELLDLMPLQVMIEVLVLELTIDDQTRAGIDWAFKNGDLAVGSAASQSVSVGAALGESATTILSQGFSIVSQTKNFTALLQAFAEDSKLNVLSNPVLITSENKPASIDIVNDVPIESSTITTPTAGQPLTETTVQYRSVGIKLNITPRINKNRFVSLKISQESSSVNEAAVFTQPAFSTRSTNTNIVVKDKQTLVIGGLMETTKSHSNVGVPILKDIPVLGRLFKAKADRLRKSELIIFITPHVIADVSEANQATKSFRSKLLNIKKDFKLQKIKN